MTIVLAGDADEKLVRGLRAGGLRARVSVLAGGLTGAGLRELAGEDPRDLVLLDADVLPTNRDWLAALAHAARGEEHAGLAAPKLLGTDGRIRSAGLAVEPADLARCTHRYRGMNHDFGPAAVAQPVLAAIGACLYIRHELLNELDDGPLDALALCLRCWQSGRCVAYAPVATLRCGEHAPASSERPQLPAGWANIMRVRHVAAPSGTLRIAYVTESTATYGGHRDVFEHLNRLAARGHEVALYTLGEPPDWFELRVPVRTFKDYDALAAALEPLDAIKVATWWKTAAPVWRASVLRGIPAYFVQDIETSYYPDDERRRFEVLASYRPEFSYLTISGWNRDRLRELGLDAALVAPGVDHQTFMPRRQTARRDDMLLAIGRSLPLKNLPLTLAAWRRLEAPRPELRLFGGEPELASAPGIVYELWPSDDRVGELMCEATLFVQTSIHEGFCLPVLEAMASGTPVVCTDADGNRDFCIDGENCLMPKARAGDVAAAIARLMDDPELRRKLGEAGRATAANYRWERRIDELEHCFQAMASARALRTTAAPS